MIELFQSYLDIFLTEDLPETHTGNIGRLRYLGNPSHSTGVKRVSIFGDGGIEGIEQQKKKKIRPEGGSEGNPLQTQTPCKF